MDLYRYFHPHHNPRLRNIPLRLQELAELEQAATELQRALERAELRLESEPVGAIQKEHLSEVLVAASYLRESLHTLTQAHPGDSNDTMNQLLHEREDAPGWENWVRLVKQRLRILSQYDAPPVDTAGKTENQNNSNPQAPESDTSAAQGTFTQEPMAFYRDSE